MASAHQTVIEKTRYRRGPSLYAMKDMSPEQIQAINGAHAAITGPHMTFASTYQQKPEEKPEEKK